MELNRESGAVTDKDALYDLAAKQVHLSGGRQTLIGDMDVDWLRNTIKALRHSHRKTFYEIVLARKVQDLNRAIAQRDAQELDDYYANGGGEYPCKHAWSEAV